jgi:hypothetical protein
MAFGFEEFQKRLADVGGGNWGGLGHGFIN